MSSFQKKDSKDNMRELALKKNLLKRKLFKKRAKAKQDKKILKTS